jgi:ferredoxin
VAINIVTLKMMVQEMGTEEIHKDLAKAAIAAAATCPPELSLEEL